jgi:ectoine hydroxylase
VFRKSATYDEFWERGFTVLRNVFTAGEADILRRAVTQNDHMERHWHKVQSKFESGKYPSFETIFVWNDTSGDDIFAKFTRSNKTLGVVSELFKDDAYVYHNKVALKYPGMPGFRHHQDYYYWYKMGCLYPDLATAYIAIDQATRSNGCLRFIEGSHKLGRLEHTLYDGVSDSGVDEDRLEAIRQRMPEVHVELEPGDVALFHCNMLHGSDANHSDQPRLALLGCYNTKHNDPFIRDHPHPNYVHQSLVREPVTEADVDRLPDFSLSYEGV